VVCASAGLLVASPGMFDSAAGAATPTPPFAQCPAVGYNTSCTLLMNVTNTGVQILQDPHATKTGDPAPGAYDGVEDTLIGVVNNSNATITSLPLSSTQTAFGFDDDGICQDPNSTSHMAGPVVPCGTNIVHGSNYNASGGPYPDKDNAKDFTGYGGPDGFFTGISPDHKTGTINFVTPLAPGATTYFSLEEQLTAGVFCRDSITLAPLTQTQPVGGPAVTVTATLINNFTPDANMPVTFRITSGPNAGATSVITTDTNGLAKFTYLSSAAGTDTVTASYVDPFCGTHSASPATVTWVLSGPSITTQATPTAITVGTSITVGDTATFHGATVAPTGSVAFTLYSDSACTMTTGVNGSGTITTTGGVSTASYMTTWSAPATGTYYWRASYAGDGSNSPFTTGCNDANELIVVGPGSPTIATQASPATITVGSTVMVSDTATFASTTSVPPSGSVFFTLYSDSACTISTGVSGPGTIATSAGVSTAKYMTTWTAPAIGTYYWIASYPGDANNNRFTTGCNDPNESITVSPVSPSIITQAVPSSTIVGTPITVSDTATFQSTTSSVAPTGSVTFTLYSDSACTIPAGVSGSGHINSSGGVSSAMFSGPWTAPATGTYYWQANYGGDANNNPFTTSCNSANELIVVNPGSPSITTDAGPTVTTVGTATSVGDTATFHNTTLVPPTGSVTFTLYSDNNCTLSTGISGPAVIATSNGVSSASFATTWTAPATGTYFWRANYNGDANNNAFTTGCGDTNELIAVSPESPTMTTQANPTAVTTGTSITVGDTATFHNASIAPTGAVTFTLYSDNTCMTTTGISGPGVITTTNSVSSANYSTTWTAPAPGTYYWVASYAGDQNNNAFTTGCTDANESVTVSPASSGGGGPTQDPTTVTTFLRGGGNSGTNVSVPPGTPVTDLATLSGLNATSSSGTMTYNVYADPNCQVPVVAGGYEPIFRGSVPGSASVTLNTPGTYYWRASYSGDILNFPSTSNCGDEVETVTSASHGNAVDHFLCYSAASTPAAVPGFKVPGDVRLINQFSPNGFVPKIGAVDTDCNPVQKTVPTGVTPIRNPDAHLLCWNISGTTIPETVVVSNQFGSATLQTGATSQMCLPSWSNMKVPPANKPSAPPGLSHFACYSVSYAPGGNTFEPPPSVKVKDQFSNKSVSVKVGAPELLCLPTTKIANGVTYKMQNPQTHLLCYAVSSTPTVNSVFDKNQFGTGRVAIQKTTMLCLPSTKVVVPATG